MKVAIGQLATARPMGQQVYEQAIQTALQEVAPDVEFVRRSVTSLRSSLSADRRIPWQLLDQVPSWVAAETLGRWVYGRADVVHRLDLRLPPAPGPEIVTAHDLPGLRYPDEGSVPRFLAAGARRAAVVIVPSLFAGNELVELLGVDRRRLRVIPYGLAESSKNPPSKPSRRIRLPAGRFVLHAAGATLRKNLGCLAAAWSQVAVTHCDVSMVLAGPDDERRSRLFAGLPRVLLLGARPPDDIAWLMTRASAVIVPSRYEGFGLPALEGMAAGIPVVAARTSALPEVCAEAAELVDPDATGLAAGMRRVLDDSDYAAELGRRGRLRAATFSWTRAAEAHMQAYRDVVG